MAQLPSLFHQENRLSHHPLRALRAMQQQMDRWFDQMIEPSFNDFEFMPSVDVEETDREYVLNFDIPGVNKEDIKIDLRDNMLVVSGERREEREEKEKKGAVRSERFFGSFQRSFRLPASVKAEQVTADYADGVLCLKIPKSEVSKAQSIKIGDRSKTQKH